MRYLLDTNVLIRWLAEPKKLSREQYRILTGLDVNPVPVGVSAVTLLELAALQVSRRDIRGNLTDALDHIEAADRFRLFALTPEIAREMIAIGDYLRDPADRAIVATARVHDLILITADERIIESRLAPTIA